MASESAIDAQRAYFSDVESSYNSSPGSIGGVRLSTSSGSDESTVVQLRRLRKSLRDSGLRTDDDDGSFESSPGPSSFAVGKEDEDVFAAPVKKGHGHKRSVTFHPIPEVFDSQKHTAASGQNSVVSGLSTKSAESIIGSPVKSVYERRLARASATSERDDTVLRQPVIVTSNRPLASSTDSVTFGGRAPVIVTSGVGHTGAVATHNPVSEDANSPAKTMSERRNIRSFTTGAHLLNEAETVTPRYKSAGRHQIGEVDAQQKYPPEACVFVANLPEPKDDETLEAAVTREFAHYGVVFVKIRRDSHNMPFAFCQYTRVEDAKNAQENAKGTIICGRPCRTEMVKANRAYVIYKKNRGHITTIEARQILEPYGDLAKCELLKDHIQEAMDLPPAIFVEFAVFNPSRDLLSAARQNEGYRIEPFDGSKKKSLSPRSNTDQAFLQQYEVDRRSVWVGGLPFDTDKDEVMDFFSEVGKVVNVDIIKRPALNGSGNASYAFAFVEYSRADVPDVAISRFEGAVMRGNVLRIQRKQVKHAPRTTPRRIKSEYRLTTNPWMGSDNIDSTPKTPTNRGKINQPSPAPIYASRKISTPVAYATEPLTTPQATPGISTMGTGLPPKMAPLVVQASPSSAVHQGYMMYPGNGQAYSPNYVTSPTHGQPGMYGVGALQVPSTPTMLSPHAVTYPFSGGYWPGMSTFYDSNGNAYFAYSPSMMGGMPAPDMAVYDIPSGPGIVNDGCGANNGQSAD